LVWAPQHLFILQLGHPPYIEKQKTPKLETFPFMAQPQQLILIKEEVKGNTRLNCILLIENGNKICTQTLT
jgi:hypothetical protein